MTLTKSWWYDLVAITLLVAVLFGLWLGSRPLAVPDEGRYAEIPREMIIHQQYITPHLDEIKYFEKPPLQYWLEVAAIKCFGLSEWALRLPVALLGLLGCLLTYGATRVCFDRSTAWLAALMLATSPLYFGMAHLLTLDMCVSICLTTTLLTFLLATRAPPGLRRRLLLYACYASAACGVLAKGLVAVLLPGLIIAVWIVLCGQWRQLRTLYLPTGLLLFAAIAVPWHLAVQHANPEFFHFYFIEQQFSRYLTLSAGRYKPFYFFLPIIALGFFPWTVFLPQAIMYAWRERYDSLRNNNFRTTTFLGLWALLVTLFFSWSKSKLIPYILPVIPPLAILTAHYLRGFLRSDAPLYNTALKWGFRALAILAILIAITLVVLPHTQKTLNDVSATYLYVGLMAFVVCVYTMVSLYYYRRQKFLAALISLLMGNSLFLVTLNLAVPTVDTRSIKPLTEILLPHLQSGDEVASYSIYYQDLPFYLRRRVTIVDWQNELSFGMQHQADVNWMTTSSQFWQRWQGPKQRYAIMPLRVYFDLKQHGQKQLYVLAATPDNILVTNQP